ncbi:hypothetical protein [Acidovorax sp. LjRoot117]|uniref:hypothetical protein n=1 Tax=Acidovorax sp. LjRoot117 TaxID=3342255 RepID=UPI003ECC4324
MKRTVLLTLVLINVALVMVLAGLWVTPKGQLRNVHWEAPRAQKADYVAMLPRLSDAAPVDTGLFVAILERPLFSVTRRPPPPPPPPEPTTPALVDNLSSARISGIFQGPSGASIIINIAGVDRRVRLNESIEGWVLQSVSGMTATFVGSGQTRTLTLPRAALTSYTGQPAAVVPPPSSPPPAAAAPLPGSADASTNGGAAAPNRPDPRRATFGGSR